MKREYIGLLDSGVGGLSVLKRVAELLPRENYVFFGDTKNVPYGTKTPEQIFEYTKKILDYFLTLNVKHVVIACNTTSAVGYDGLKKHFEGKLNIIPLIQTAASFAAQGLQEGDTICVMATRATVNSHKYKEEIQKTNPKLNVLEIDCTGFVEIVENRLYDDIKSYELVKSKLDIARKAKAKRIVLGCTHYPYLVGILRSILDVEYFDPAKSVAQKAKETIHLNGCAGERRFFVSANPEEFIKSAKMFFEVDSAELVQV